MLNAITPATAFSCHYHFGFAPFRPGSRGLDEQIKSAVTRIFGEDRVILEAQQRALDASPGLRLRELAIDGGAARARRLIERWLTVEREAEVAQAPPP